MSIDRRKLLLGTGAGLILSRRALAASHGLATPPTIGLLTTGDSIPGCLGGYFYQALGNPEGSTADCGDPAAQAAQTYYSRAAASVPLLWRSMSISGTRLNTNGYPDLVPLAASPYIALLPTVSPFKGLTKVIVTTGIVSNDACVGTYGSGNFAEYAAALAACLVSIQSTFVALGVTTVKLGLSTCLPRGDGTMTQANWEGFNSTVTGTGWAADNGIDVIIDINSQSQMGQWTAPSDPTLYQSDKIHPTVPFGQSLLAPIFLSGINTLIAMF